MTGHDEEKERAASGAAAAPAEPKASPATPSVDPRAILGAKGRRALLAKLPPMGVPGAQILDAMKLEADGDLAKILELTADDFLDPLWERMQGRSS
ncbi:MAG: hypothetical protein U0234_10005 [Sandaracinus sp.]